MFFILFFYFSLSIKRRSRNDIRFAHITLEISITVTYVIEI